MESTKFFAFFALCLAISGAASFTIECEYKYYNWGPLGSIYQCETIITEGSLEYDIVTNVIGVHLEGLTDEDVTGLYIYGDSEGELKTPSFFPRGISQFFPHLIALQFSYTAIESLNGDELSEFPKLAWFGVSGSDLESISSELFVPTPNIIVAWFPDNVIERVGRDLFASLNVTQLQWVHFERNLCINQFARYDVVAIQSLIDDIRVECLLEDEQEFCFEGSIDEFVCELAVRLENTGLELSEELTTRDERINELEEQLGTVNAELVLINEELQWIRDELLRNTTSVK